MVSGSFGLIWNVRTLHHVVSPLQPKGNNQMASFEWETLARTLRESRERRESAEKRVVERYREDEERRRVSERVNDNAVVDLMSSEVLEEEFDEEEKAFFEEHSRNECAKDLGFLPPNKHYIFVDNPYKNNDILPQNKDIRRNLRTVVRDVTKLKKLNLKKQIEDYRGSNYNRLYDYRDEVENASQFELPDRLLLFRERIKSVLIFTCPLIFLACVLSIASGVFPLILLGALGFGVFIVSETYMFSYLCKISEDKDLKKSYVYLVMFTSSLVLLCLLILIAYYAGWVACPALGALGDSYVPHKAVPTEGFPGNKEKFAAPISSVLRANDTADDIENTVREFYWRTSVNQSIIPSKTPGLPLYLPPFSKKDKKDVLAGSFNRYGILCVFAEGLFSNIKWDFPCEVCVYKGDENLRIPRVEDVQEVAKKLGKVEIPGEELRAQLYDGCSYMLQVTSVEINKGMKGLRFAVITLLAFLCSFVAVVILILNLPYALYRAYFITRECHRVYLGRKDETLFTKTLNATESVFDSSSTCPPSAHD